MKKENIYKFLISILGIFGPLLVLSFTGEIKNIVLRNIIVVIGIATLLFATIFQISKKNMGISATEYNNYIFFGLFLSFIPFILLILFGIVDFSGFAKLLVFFLIVCFLLYFSFFFTSKRKTEKILMEGEKKLLSYDGVKIISTAPLSLGVMPLKKILVTNKRILISMNMFGVETLSPSMKFYYKEPKGIAHDMFFFNTKFTIKKYSLQKDAVIIQFGPITAKYKMYVSNPKKLFNIIKKYSKKK